MSNWVRLWEDMPNDPKWIVIARNASQALQCVTSVSVCFVVGVFVHMLTKADKNGDLQNWCDEDVAASLQISTEQVSAIREAMKGKVLDGNHLKGWENRQPNREDPSTERVRAFRAKRNAMKRNETVRNAPESESDSESEFVSDETKHTHKDKHKLEEKAEPTFEQIALAGKRGLTEAELRTEWAKFKNFNLAKGTEFVNWDAAWAMWLDKIPSPKQTKQPKLNGHVSAQCFIEVDTPQWIAWDNHYRKIKGIGPPVLCHKETHKRGWYFGTEWPPPTPDAVRLAGGGGGSDG
jgi:hypothetical protein